MKRFNTTGICVPEKHYMVNIDERVTILRGMIDDGSYFTLNRGRQYGKTTTLKLLKKRIADKYTVLDMDFQALSHDSFRSEGLFSIGFSKIMINADEFKGLSLPEKIKTELEKIFTKEDEKIVLGDLFQILQKWCVISEKPIVLIIDEVDSAANDQVFLDFLAQLRLQYIEHENDSNYPTFQSVILAGVTDVKNRKRRLRPNGNARINSPWNIAVSFDVDMSLRPDGIQGMLDEYRKEHKMEMDTDAVAKKIYEYTSGYPFLVSRICQIMDEKLSSEQFNAGKSIWNIVGVTEAVRLLLEERNTLFDSLGAKLHNNKDVRRLVHHVLFAGDKLPYNSIDLAINDAIEYGFLKRDGSNVEISNRIFETYMYEAFITAADAKEQPIYQEGVSERSQFITEDGHLDMERLLIRYMECYDDIYGDIGERFDEEEGRRKFLMFLRPVINGTGNYYIEARTRNNKRMDVVVDYLGERYVIELKIWRGNAYNERGENQLKEYLDYFHLEKGYMLSYFFNKNKQQGMHEIKIGEKCVIEAVV